MIGLIRRDPILLDGFKMDNSSDFMPIDASFEEVEDKFDVGTWLNKIHKAKQKEEMWRQRAKKCIRIYRNDNTAEGTTYSSPSQYTDKEDAFNILYANTQVLKPALFSNMPKPDIRNRFLQDKALATMAGDIIEKNLIYGMDVGNFENIADQLVTDLLLTGRAVSRIRMEAVYDQKEIEETSPDGDVSIDIQEEIVEQRVFTDRVEYDKYIVEPCHNEKYVTWKGQEHNLKEPEFKKLFPDKNFIPATPQKDTERFDTDPYYTVYEIWDKTKKKVYYFGEAQEPLKIMDDPYNLKDFFPYDALYSIPTNDTLVPLPEFVIYESQAYELNQVSFRITDLIKAAKSIGIYDSSSMEMQDLLQGMDSQVIPYNGNALREGHGIKGVLDFVDITPISIVIQQLYLQRDQIKKIIDDVTGISDITRGETNPNETAKAQVLKSQYAGLRIRNRRKNINIFLVSMIRKMAEMMCRFYTLDQLQEISGVEDIPFEVENIIRDDVIRNYIIDIETDSTIMQDMDETSEKRAALIGSILNYLQGAAPLVMQGILPLETAKALLMFGLQASKIPRQLQDAIELIGTQNDEGMPAQPDPMQQQSLPQGNEDQAMLEAEMEGMGEMPGMPMMQERQVSI